MKIIYKSLLVMVAMLAVAGVFLPGYTSADTFNPNHIIDDAVFNNTNTMTATAIDSFLNQFPNSCISPNNGFSAPDPTGYNPTSGFIYGNNTSAGQVIYDAAQAYGINPEVILTTLQKEQSLVDGSAGCSVLRYAAATGYGCPDGGTTYNYSGVDLYTINGTTVTSVSGTCVNTSLKVGFSQQVIRTAWLLEFGLQRSEGNINWAVIKGNWNNSDDPQSCYGGPMTQGTYVRCPSGAAAYYDGYTTIDNTAVHMDTGATASLYWYTPHFAGNENFFNIYEGWFGTTILPVAFTAGPGNPVYIQTDGYKFSVPSMALLQDYGIEPSAIQTVSQATINSVPTADFSTTNISPGVSYIIKSPSDTDSDGATVYLVSAGKRYEITSMTQFNDFGFNTANIAYLPLSYIYSLPDGGPLSNFITTPSHNVFEVSGGSKQIIFDNSTYQSLNPSGSASFVSSYMASLVPSGNPITNSPILIGQSSGAVYLYDSGNYYGLPSMDQYNCWGFNGPLNTPFYKLADDSFVGPFTESASLSCLVNVGSSTYLLNGSNKITMPSSYGITGQNIDTNLTNLSNTLPLRSNSLGQAITSTSQPGVWFVEDGMRKSIPSLTDLRLLGISTSSLDTISTPALNALPGGGIKLGIGEVVKSPDSSTVYTITSPNSSLPFASADDFLAYDNSWANIDTLPASLLNQYYPDSPSVVSKYIYDNSNGIVYLMDRYGCYDLNSSQLAGFGQSTSSVQSNQPYSNTVFPYINLSICATGSNFVKSPDSPAVYWLDNGQRHPFSSWSALTAKAGTNNPYIIYISNSTLSTLPVGSSL